MRITAQKIATIIHKIAITTTNQRDKKALNYNGMS